jgi:DNA polymerase
MDILVVDIETYYAQGFSLSKITTEEYIRDPQFEVIGVAVKVNDGDTRWFSGTKEQTKKWLDQFPWDNCVAIAHNAAFDMAILNWCFDIRPKRIVDTLSMARAIHGTDISGSLKALVEHYALGAKGTEVITALGKHRLDFYADELARYGDYCINDVELTYALFKILVKDFPLNELKLIDLTIRMFTEPVLELDAARLELHLRHVRSTKQILLDKCIISKDNLMSNIQLAETLRACGVEPPTKISPATGKDTYAFSKTDEGFKALLEHENPLVQSIVAARLGVKSTLEESRTERFIGIQQRGKLPIPLRYYAAHTGRWGGDAKVNMQNIPRSSALKYAIEAPKGYVMIDSDSSQIEARTLAWLAGQNDLVDAFDRGEDVYKIMASAIYGKPESEITDGERFVGKTTILGAGYGMGAAKFRMQLKTFNVDLSEEECERIIRVYRETYPAIPALWAQANTALKLMMAGSDAPLGRAGVLSVEGMGGIRLPNGLRLRYPNLRWEQTDEGKDAMCYDTKRGKATLRNYIYGGKCVENVCQALARIIIGEQMIMVAKKYKVVMTVHDAIACVVPEEDAAVALEDIKTLMRVRPSWALELPLNCEAGFGKSYGDC